MRSLPVRQVLMTLSLALPALASAQTVPGGYPASYASIIDAAKKEKKLTIYSSTDQASAQFLVDDFKKLYPFVNVEYQDIGTSQLYSRYISEAAAGSPSADLLWSSAMDLQVSLASQGYALTYASPELKNFGPESNYQNQAYGTTLEPVALIYNKRLVKASDLPATHAAFATLLNSGKLTGKLATWDPEKSGVGFTLTEYDNQVTKNFAGVMAGLGKSQAGLYSSTGAMIEKVVSGEALYGYNIIGSYALLRQQKVPDLGMRFWKDGTVAFQRVAFISKTASSPNSAKLFLDYLLSRRGQLVMANQSLIYALRGDVAGKATRVTLTSAVGGAANLKVIPVSKALLSNLDQGTRATFLNSWRKAVKGN
ncbi:ABC transporter substrate-binding protein [Deinococcus sonorensis]|uniref:ABC transporter substrate-binding protein n=2 Tax=Deinococcus sonorensis TaxID=309891 RepID=A0AAU7UBJ2_9DEIO